MSNLKLQKDELELLASYEAEEWKSVKNLKNKKNNIKHMRGQHFAKINASISAFLRRTSLIYKSEPFARAFHIKLCFQVYCIDMPVAH